MSHFNVVKTKMKSRSAIVSALTKLGFEKSGIEVSDIPMTLKGYRGEYRIQQANVRLKGNGWGSENVVGGASNDLGWQLRENGEYVFHVSDFDKRKYNTQWQEQLMQSYSTEVVREDVEAYGWSIEEEEVMADQQIHLVIDVPSFN